MHPLQWPRRHPAQSPLRRGVVRGMSMRSQAPRAARRASMSAVATKPQAKADPGPKPVFRYRDGWQDNVPAELKIPQQWVNWRYELRADRRGQWKWTKPPYRPVRVT